MRNEAVDAGRYESKLWHDKDCLRAWRVLSGGENQLIRSWMNNKATK